MAIMNEDFQWAVALWKGVRDALQASSATIILAVLAAVFGALEPGDLLQYGVPLWLQPILIGAFSAVRNALRRRFGWPV